MSSGEEDFFIENPGSKAIAEFGACTTRQMFFVCLVADRDYDSPLRTLPEGTRRHKAAEIVGYPMEDGGKRLDKNGRNAAQGKTETIEKAITKYREIQYDELKDMLQAVNAQIQEAVRMMQMDKEEFCTVTKTSRTTVNGQPVETVEKRIDGKMLVGMIKDAMKLGTELTNLKEERGRLMATVPKTDNVLEGLTTYTSNDLSSEEIHDTEQSTIDIVMAQKREKES